MVPLFSPTNPPILPLMLDVRRTRFRSGDHAYRRFVKTDKSADIAAA
jgi:hypothetical protein